MGPVNLRFYLEFLLPWTWSLSVVLHLLIRDSSLLLANWCPLLMGFV